MWIYTWEAWAIFFLAVQIIHFAGTWWLYKAAGRKTWEAAVPVYNAYVLLKIIQRPTWWIVFLFLPILSPIMIMILWVDFIRCYGKRGWGEAILVIATLGFYIYYLNYVEKPAYTGPEDRKETLLSAILFAVVLATTIHTYFVQPMIIPTGSMENTLRIGDALFVSKNIYGTRIPNTPVAVPFADLFNRSLFIEKLQLPYARIPGWKKVEKNDIVVFNYPADSVYNPTDRKDNYVKRCVATPGDVIEIKNAELFINHEKFIPKKDAKIQYKYIIESKTQLSPKYLEEEFSLVSTDYAFGANENGFIYEFHGLSDEIFQALKNNSNIISANKLITPKDQTDHNIFPKDAPYNQDWYGPLTVPKKGMQIKLDIQNLADYIDIIETYENHDLEVSDGQLLMDGQPIENYTFQQDYYFMMGDNRHNSLDSRFWGFVPETHIVGQPFFLWANLNQLMGFEPKSGFHWERWFTVPNNGNPNKTSYLWIGAILLAIFLGWDFFFKKKKDK